MTKTNEAAKRLVADFFKGTETAEYDISEATKLLGKLGDDAKVDMIAAGTALMLARLAENHGVHVIDCLFAVPKWLVMLAAEDKPKTEQLTLF